MSKLLAAGLAHPESRIGGLRPAVAGFLGYAISHQAHHRGQICLLARQVGCPLPLKAAFGMWEWGKLWNECGLGR